MMNIELKVAITDRMARVDRMWEAYPIIQETFTQRIRFRTISETKDIYVVSRTDLGSILVSIKAMVAGEIPTAVCLTDADIRNTRYDHLQIIAVRIGKHVTLYPIKVVEL
jgi:hypothetical protein